MIVFVYIDFTIANLKKKKLNLQIYMPKFCKKIFSIAKKSWQTKIISQECALSQKKVLPLRAIY